MTVRRPDGRRGPASGWLSGIDGMRALAVAAVVAFHLDPDVLPGGFLGVDVFFAISGFLITRLVLVEIHGTGRLDLLTFYRRRWRRLAPAVLVLLATVTLACITVWRDELATLRGGVLASLGYVTNWWLIYDKQSYFVASGRPPMVQHLWSLAVEEQFYLVWPVLLAVLLGARCLRRRAAPVEVDAVGLWRLVVGAGVLAFASAAALAAISISRDIPYGTDSARVYFGTDTHASGLLFGAALGALSVARIVRPDQRWHGAVRRRLGAVTTEVLAVVALGAVGFALVTGSEFDPGLYRTGLPALGAASAVAVATVSRSGSLIGRALDVRPLRWLGRRSYAVYLWHWPVVVVTRPELDIGGPRWLLVINQIVIIVLLASASYAWVEVPVRNGTFARWWHGHPRQLRIRRAPSTGRDARRPAVAGALSVGVVLAAVVAAQQSGHTPAGATNEAWRPPGSGASYRPSPTVTRAASRESASRESTPHQSTSHPSTGKAIPRPGHRPAARSTARSGSPTRPGSAARRPGPARTHVDAVSAFGDSVMLGAAPALVSAVPHLSVSAVEGRQARAVFDDIVQVSARHALGGVVVIHTGDNGVIAPGDLRSTLSGLRSARRVVLLTVRVSRDWQGPNNDTLRRTARQFRNVRVLDWYSCSSAHRGWFYNDGLHLRPSGAVAYARLVGAAITAK